MEITPEMIARQSPEAQQMIVYLLGRVAACERWIAELEERLEMTLANSSLPLSSLYPHKIRAIA